MVRVAQSSAVILANDCSLSKVPAFLIAFVNMLVRVRKVLFVVYFCALGMVIVLTMLKMFVS